MYTPYYRILLNETVARERAAWEAQDKKGLTETQKAAADKAAVNHLKTGPEPSATMPAARPKTP